jgi:LPXTG-site transpeptidase (sortase) family protein
MNGPMNEGGFLTRLRENETLRKLSGGRPDLLIFGAPVVLIAVIVAAVIGVVAVTGGGGGDDAQASRDETPTSATTPTPKATPGESGGDRALTPIAFDPADQLTLADLARRGSGLPARGDFNGSRIMIPKIGVNAEFSYKVVGGDGQMPNPNGPTDVAYYDFSQWPGLGGLPGAGGNVVVAGHVDYIRHGPAVFWDLHNLAPGDIVQIQMNDGSVIEYAIEFNKHIEVGDADWTAIVAGTAEESITLITCGGEFEAGHYTNRQILWGRRVT